MLRVILIQMDVMAVESKRRETEERCQRGLISEREFWLWQSCHCSGHCELSQFHLPSRTVTTPCRASRLFPPDARYTCDRSSTTEGSSRPCAVILILCFTNSIGCALSASNPFFSTLAIVETAWALSPTLSAPPGFVFHRMVPDAHMRRVNGSGGQKSASVPSGRSARSG